MTVWEKEGFKVHVKVLLREPIPIEQEVAGKRLVKALFELTCDRLLMGDGLVILESLHYEEGHGLTVPSSSLRFLQWKFVKAEAKKEGV